MEVEIMVSVAVSLWVALMLVAVSLCRTAKTGDDQMLAALAHQGLGDTPMPLMALGAPDTVASRFEA